MNILAAWWTRRIRRDREATAQQVFHIAPDRLGPVIDGVQCLTLAQASLRLWTASGSTGADDGFTELVEAILQDRIPAALLSPAPPHHDPQLTGKVTLTGEFWRKVWSVFASNGPEPSSEWLGWLLAGGIVVEAPVIDTVASALSEKAKYELAQANRATAFRNEGFVRTTFQLFWTTFDALAWIVCRDEAAVASIAAAVSPLTAERLGPWDALVRCSAMCAGQDNLQALVNAMMDLARRLHRGDLEAKEWPLSGDQLKVLQPADFDRARFAPGTNSAGLLGGDLAGRADHYVMFRPDDIRNLWAAPEVSGEGGSAPELAPVQDDAAQLHGSKKLMPDSEVEQWCREWLGGGHGNFKGRQGMDPAWRAFQALPRAQGLSRDLAFRPTFLRAKTTVK